MHNSPINNHEKKEISVYQSCFAHNYVNARERFLEAARLQECQLQSFLNPVGKGIDGEDLTMDIAYYGDAAATSVLVLTSAMHGEEGFCGSGCQVALLRDQPLLDEARQAGVGILLIHAVNAYGFSWGHRTNEDNIDLNRNFCNFEQPLRDNPYYQALHPLLVPAVWPPDPDNEAAIQAFIRQEGMQAYKIGMMMGQHVEPQGLFYGGQGPSWSNRTLREVFRAFGRGRQRMGWVDIHTGLGPCGHGEKIFVQKGQDEYARARAWWGADVTSVSDPSSSTVDIAGTGTQAMLEECADVPELTFMALEYGTVPLDQVFLALRGDRWLACHPEADDATRKAMKAAHRAAFYVDTDAWRGAILAQSRVCILQAIRGLSS
ncbi:DUF2817 domain-containing protein [Allopusillimonas ginsengisoli]|nr:DUF2817 domain-containing protein [Allopusillimonas ginsengisoli]